MASDKVRCPVCGWVGRPTPKGKMRKHAGVGDRPSCSGSGQPIAAPEPTVSKRDHRATKPATPTTIEAGPGWDPGAS